MREKKPTLIITFSTTSAAMAMDRLAGEKGLPGRLIPVPREITAGCGLAWKAEPEAEEELTRQLHENSLQWETMRVILL
jgi:hypothetical protein